MGKVKIALVVAALALVGGAGFVYMKMQQNKAEAEALTEVKTQSLGKDQIQQGIGGGGDLLAALQQIDKLKPEEQVALFTKVLADPDAKKRLAAVGALGRIAGTNAEARALLEKVSREDADASVKETAAALLAPPAPAGAPQAPVEDEEAE